MFKTLEQVQKDLQTLATQHGRKGFDAAKAAYFKRFSVADAEGNLLSVEDVEKSLDIEFDDDGNDESTASKGNDGTTAISLKDVEAIVQRAVKSATATKATDRSGFAGAHSQKSDIVVRGYKPRYLKSKETAYKAGVWLMATLGRSSKAAEKCAELGMPIRMVTKSDEIIEVRKGQIEGSNALGGFLVPPEFDDEMIDLLERYGVFRKFARYTPMSRDEKTRRRRKGGLTFLPVGEAQAGTESTMQWDVVKLVAKKGIVLDTWSSELNEDSAVSIADEFFNEATRAIGQKEDQCGFIGDGTNTYFNIVGIETKAIALGTIANTQCLQVQTGTSSFSGLLLRDFYNTMKRVQSAGHLNARWYCNPTFYMGEMLPLLQAQFNTKSEVTVSMDNAMFLGKPVVFAEAMPWNWEASKVFAWYGDLSLAAMFGDRRQVTIGFSDSALNAFEQDETAVRATSRFDINVHDIGTNHATASSRVKGPIAGLISASS